ncbi:MAG: hypothetical protein ACSHX8_07210 [Opitutaceae bacterium]
MKHKAATMEAVLGRKPNDPIMHYEVKCLADTGIASSRSDTYKLRGREYVELGNIGTSNQRSTWRTE